MDTTEEAAALMANACTEAGTAVSALAQSEPAGWVGGAASAEAEARAQLSYEALQAAALLEEASQAVRVLQAYVLVNGWSVDGF